MKYLIILFFLVSCSTTNEKFKKNNEILNFDKELSFDEFNKLANKYSDRKTFPNIDK